MLWYYYPSTEEIDRPTQFGAVGYIITLYSSKSYVKSCGVRPNFGEVRTPDPQWLRPWLLTNTVKHYTAGCNLSLIVNKSATKVEFPEDVEILFESSLVEIQNTFSTVTMGK